MTEDIEEKEKCLEKLKQMQKYLPFLDFMIDKIQKNNAQKSLEFQLNKFQNLRYLIAERTGSYNWDIIVKVEEIIEKLISKLDFKDSNEKFKGKAYSLSCKTRMAASVSMVPSSTAAVSVVTTVNPQTTTVDLKPQDSSKSVVNLIMKTLKTSVDSKSARDKELLSRPLDPLRHDVPEKTMETDLNKDLDGFDLTDCPGLSETESNSIETVRATPGKTSHNDLLSSSREKLLKSLQSRLYPTGIPASSTIFPVSKNVKKNEPQNSAFNTKSELSFGEHKTKSDVSENSVDNATGKGNRKDTPVNSVEKKGLVLPKLLKSSSSSDKCRNYSSNRPLGDVNFKQKLKEKLSTDICEVYRVPGKSVGGSLRSLKESKEHRKSFTAEEEFFKSDKFHRSRLTSETMDNLSYKSHRDSLHSETKEKKSDHSSEKYGSSNSSSSKDFDNKNSEKTIRHLKKSEGKSPDDGKISTNTCFELNKVNDEELLGFVRENVESFPFLAKMKLPELKQVVRSSIVCKREGLDADAISDISDNSLEDLDEAVSLENKNSKPDAQNKTEKKDVTNADKKLGNPVNISSDENLSDEDYAVRLIEATTPTSYPPKKKLELPMLITDDLFKDISSIESFESIQSTPETKDTRVNKPLESSEVNEEKLESNVESFKVIKEVSINNRANPQLPEDTSQSSKPQTDKGIQEKLLRQKQFTLESFKPSIRNVLVKPPCNKDPRLHFQSFREAKSYAEHKRRKLEERQKGLKESCKSTESLEAKNASRMLHERENTKGNNNQDIRRRDSLLLETNATTDNSTLMSKSKRKKSRKRRKKEEGNEKTEEDGNKKKSAESEELVSPLEELYRNDSKPKTGRGYGLQNFKIPKKTVQSSQTKKTSETVKKSIPNDSIKDIKKSQKQEEETSQVVFVESTKVEESKESDLTLVDSTHLCKNGEKVESSESSPKSDSIVVSSESNSSLIADSSENRLNTKGAVETDHEPESHITSADTDIRSEVISDRTEVQQTPIVMDDVKEKVTAKKVETQIVECDSSVVETFSMNEQTSEKDCSPTGDRSTVLPKEEITQEFVEALIRKSFQSGEGKLLLAQMKLFENFARKLNSKKLKTIQKIINSESDTSSSPPESSSEDEGKKRKGKKSEEKSRSKKRRKKGKSKKRRRLLLLSSSSSDSESSEEEKSDKIKGKTENKNNDSVSLVTPGSEESKIIETITTSEGSKPKKKESSDILRIKSRNEQKNVEFGRNFSKGRAKRKQEQKKMIEQILNEEPQPEASNDSNTDNTCEAPPKESEPKTKQKTKAKAKTELDRLHDDIRSMFICEGVVTATGQRMCRILKQSGGNMNNLDIVKESAKMVEEEKLKKVQTRKSGRKRHVSNSGAGEIRSRSQSLDKAKGLQENEEGDRKLALEPRVALQRVDLDNIGYGIKISDDCISFKRMKGKNTALRRSRKSRNKEISESLRDNSLTMKVFLERNKRKFERLKSSDRKKSYLGKKLTEVVKNLPLKMAKMKHLQICKKKNDEASEKNFDGVEKTDEIKTKFSDFELKRYAFEKKKEIYSCKLCTCFARNITVHYKANHPESEVLISRLNIQEANRAKLEVMKNACDEMKNEQNSFEELSKRKVKTLVRRGVTYNCRMCPLSRITELNTFASHVSTHTGEFRYKCPSEGCTIHRVSLKDIKFHILTKHPKCRSELNNKITESYELTVGEGLLFGFLCSKCHFVQICRRNLENHVSSQHQDSKDVKIIKINMSGRKMGRIRNKSEETVASTSSKKCRRKGLVSEVEKPSADQTKESEAKESKKEKLKTENEPKMETEPFQKKILSIEISTAIEKKAEKKFEEGSQEALNEEEINVEETGTVEECDTYSRLETEDCVDLKTLPKLKGNYILEAAEKLQEKEFCGEDIVKVVEPSMKVRVGPLEAQMLVNSEVQYECFVNGCLFSTRVYDLFHKHITVMHWSTKWNGLCQTCSLEKNGRLPEFQGRLNLSEALKHLKLHEDERFPKSNTANNLTEFKCTCNHEKLSVDDDQEWETNPRDISTIEEENDPTNNFAETSYPVKPLLRVRNLIGDRLSTPKADENVVEVGGGDSNKPEKSTHQKMFKIENVRSLTEVSTEDSGLKIEQVCSLKDRILQPGLHLGSDKTIIVRSCPTRTIAIQPELSALSVDAERTVRPPVGNHPVVLSPVSSNNSILIRPKTPQPKLIVQPIFITVDNNTRLTSSGKPAVAPLMSPTKVVAGDGEDKTQEDITGTKSSIDSENVPSPCKSPTGSKNISSDQEDQDGKEVLQAQKIQCNPRTGKKSVKDAKIYQEMLTKQKLCHLFKCMGIECSFTCNSELVFTQHIGLHEAERRLERNKCVRTLRMASRASEAFPWQQCAYCCEVLNCTNNALSLHIIEEHGHCMYQCAFCFYRALSHSYVEIHQNLAHSQVLKTTPRLIYKCKPLRFPPSQAAALEKHGRRQSVRPYHCDQCGRNFYLTNEFTNHLSSEHQSVTAYTCHICKNLCFKVNRLINHYRLHSYSLYQCAYCLHGTETEKEMVFHLSNFHFSQPAVMYMRALAEGQKNHASNQLDSLKVIVYESDTMTSDCVIEVEQEEETTEGIPATNTDLSAIAAELGISTGLETSSTSSGVTPLMQELASIGDKAAKNLTVKTLLPNAQFSSENEAGMENCAVLISSGLSVPLDQNGEREMSIPLGQLPLEAVNIQHNETSPPTVPSNSFSPSEKNLKLNEIIVNHYCKSLVSVEEEKVVQPSVILSSAVHKLPPVVLTRTSSSKSFYPAKCIATRKKSEEQLDKESDEEQNGNQKSEYVTNEKTSGNKIEQVESDVENKNSSSRKNSIEGGINVVEPLLTNAISSSNESEKGDPKETVEAPVVISQICSLSKTLKDTLDISKSVVINIQTKVNSPLKPPIIRVEDFPIDENIALGSSVNTSEKSVKNVEKESEKEPLSPEVVIIERKDTKDVVTVTIDSDEEKCESLKKVLGGNSEEGTKVIIKDINIRKEMEVLRNKIRKETDLLLTEQEKEVKNPIDNLYLHSRPDDSVEKSKLNLSVDVRPDEEMEKPNEKILLSPIEEAICSLNKILRSETEEAQKKEKEDKKETDESSKKTDESSKKTEESENKESGRRRTRFGTRGRKKGGEAESEKSEGDENSCKKDDTGKMKKFIGELSGKELFICGNERCNFAADDDLTLKDHLYVCDLSRESSTLVCPHCSRQIKQFHPYLEHLRYHGIKRFHCGLCSFSSAVESSTSRHVKQKHKSSFLKILPKESEEGHLVYYPKNYKLDKNDFEVDGYSPGDEDKLPLQSVYQVNVKCAKCPYFTKVRSNMVRHLKIHVKSVETEGVVVVPSTAPTNPVPCLETKEKMFDKMTNLAASSQLAQAKEKIGCDNLSPEEEAKLPQFITEQMRYKCCLSDCNYITVDDGMLRHHIKALHGEINYYSCPHCKDTVHADVRNVTLDKIGHHLKHHDAKLYKCAHCIYFHYQRSVVEKHTIEKHPDRRYFVYTVREPKPETASEEESSCSIEGSARVWKCALCDEFKTHSKPTLMDHLLKSHNTKSKYKCQFCSMKGNNHAGFVNHFSSKHPEKKVSYIRVYYAEKVACLESQSGNSSGADSSNDHFDTTPLWQRGAPRIRHIRGILIEEEEIKTKKCKKISVDENESDASSAVLVKENAFYCPLCTNKKKPFFTRNEDCFRTHLYQELNYQQFACILCGKMFVDRKDFERHHTRIHSDKPQALKQTKEDHEIKFWVDQVIAKKKKQMEERKRKLSDAEASDCQNPPKKKKEI